MFRFRFVIFAGIGPHVCPVCVPQGPCHENQNCIATHESNGLDIIIALILNDINPLGKTRMDLVLDLKNNASKLLLAIMESRADSENAERILSNMNPKQLVSRHGE